MNVICIAYATLFWSKCVSKDSFQKWFMSSQFKFCKCFNFDYNDQVRYQFCTNLWPALINIFPVTKHIFQVFASWPNLIFVKWIPGCTNANTLYSRLSRQQHWIPGTASLAWQRQIHENNECGFWNKMNEGKMTILHFFENIIDVKNSFEYHWIFVRNKVILLSW